MDVSVVLLAILRLAVKHLTCCLDISAVKLANEYPP
jgi:hypothetical protein